MAHRADTTFELRNVFDAAESGCHHVAMFEGCDHVGTLVRIVAQPMEQLGKSPLMGINAATPVDRFESGGMGFGCNLLSFSKRAMIAPEIVFVQRFKALTHRNDTGAGGIKRNSSNRAALDASALQSFSRCRDQCGHLVGMGLGCKIGVFAAAMQRIRYRCGSDRAFFAVDQSDANTECAEVNSGDDCHVVNSSKQPLSRTQIRVHDMGGLADVKQASTFWKGR